MPERSSLPTPLEALAAVQADPARAADALLSIAGGFTPATAHGRTLGIDDYRVKTSVHNIRSRVDLYEALARAGMGVAP